MADIEDVIDNYLVWEFCKQEGMKRRILDSSVNGENLKQEIVEKAKKRYRENDWSREEKINRIRELDTNPVHRVKMFEYCSWERETVKVEDLGTTLPHAMGLPPEVISGRLPDVIEFVREADPEKYRSVKYIMSLKEVPEVLNEFLPTVITPGSLIRRRDRMNREHGEKDWSIKDTWGAFHDGNHRLVAKILAEDLEKIECYVGRPSSDEIYEHVEL